MGSDESSGPCARCGRCDCAYFADHRDGDCGEACPDHPEHYLLCCGLVYAVTRFGNAYCLKCADQTAAVALGKLEAVDPVRLSPESLADAFDAIMEAMQGGEPLPFLGAEELGRRR